MAFGPRRAKVFPRFPTYNYDPYPPTLQTDGRTDRRHAISLPRFAL